MSSNMEYEINNICDLLSQKSILNCPNEEKEYLLKTHQQLKNFLEYGDYDKISIYYYLSAIKHKHKEYLSKITFFSEEQMVYKNYLIQSLYFIPDVIINDQNHIIAILQFLYKFYDEFIDYLDYNILL